MENLEKILRDGYRDSILHKYFPENGLSYREWKDLFSLVLDVFGGSEDDIEFIMKSYSYQDTNEPMKEILEYIINIFISYQERGPLWKDIVKIERKFETTPYKTYLTYTIKVSSKDKQLMSLSPEWVWKNHEEVTEFMSPENKFYEKIKKLDGKYTNL